MSKKDRKKEAVILRVRNLHIHLDEHMETTNHFEKEDAPCCCGCQDGGCGCCDGDVEIDLDELAAEITGETRIEDGIVKKVLAAEERILEKLGVVEIVKEETTEEEDDAQEGHTADDSHSAQEAHKPESNAADFLENEFPEMLGQLLGGAILMGIMESVLPEGMRPGKKSETGGTGYGKDRK